LSVPAALASLYLALHSVIVSACAELCMARAATIAAAANKKVRVVIAVSSWLFPVQHFKVV
jgi:hypothetical protein